AERILLDLRDKVEKLDGASGAFAVSSVRNDAVAALLTLGYSRPAAEKAVRDVIKDNSAIEDVIKDALAELKK
ncbi:MAG TPA: Holliday junction branch migration protein RuvA, partial [Ignavibacteriales bacterium]|nr:Holliday junction branch migration protein RuvA [Ignavibacteriales bacterium]